MLIIHHNFPNGSSHWLFNNLFLFSSNIFACFTFSISLACFSFLPQRRLNESTLFDTRPFLMVIGNVKCVNMRYDNENTDRKRSWKHCSFARSTRYTIMKFVMRFFPSCKSPMTLIVFAFRPPSTRAWKFIFLLRIVSTS